MNNTVLIIIIAAVVAIVLGWVLGRVFTDRMIKAEEAKLDERANQANEKARTIEMEARDKGYRIQKESETEAIQTARGACP